METKYLKAAVACIPLRAEARDGAEMVSQLIFGEYVEVISRNKQWLELKNISDGYMGWADYKLFEEVNALPPSFPKSTARVKSSFLLATNQHKNQLILSAGSYLGGYNATDHTFIHRNKTYHISMGEVLFGDENLSLQESLQLAKQFIDVPYLWGGRSVFGIDCSGFTQIVYSLMGIFLKRDASQMVDEGTSESFIQNANPGDLAFFGDDDEKITHVGIILEDQTIIHASGYVRVDKIDAEGIYNIQEKKYSHSLRTIKRLV